MEDTGTVITLRADRARAGIAPWIGGSIAHYHWLDGARRHDWLRPAAPADLAAGTADRLACFPLVPFSNRIRDGRFAFGGHAVALPLNHRPQPHALHGHGWQAAWSVVERDEDRITLEYDHRAGAWPFPYRARQEFLLTGDELRLSLSLENRGRETMPVGLGFHPYFPRTPRCRLSARVDAMWATDAEVMPTALVDADPRLGGAYGLPVADVLLDNAFTGWQQAGDDNLAGTRRPAPARRRRAARVPRRLLAGRQGLFLRRAGQPLHRRFQSGRARSRRYRHADARSRRQRVRDHAPQAEPGVTGATGIITALTALRPCLPRAPWPA